MSAVLAPLRFVALGEADLLRIMDIEQQAYPYPWSLGNFRDSMRQGYHLQGCCDPQGRLLAYLVAMPGVQEVHLLNITVAPDVQGRGHGRAMLDALCDWARARDAHQLWLEVRASNARARRIYIAYGFEAVGLRRGYYPAQASRREDAVVMRLALSAQCTAPLDAHSQDASDEQA